MASFHCEGGTDIAKVDPAADPLTADDDGALVDKLKGGDYAELIASAQKGKEAQDAAQALCLQKNGDITKSDPHTAFYAPKSAPAAPEPTYEDDLKRLRQERMRQMQDEQRWRKLGHGELRELQDEKEFLGVIKPHERAIVLLKDGRPAGASVEVEQVLTRLAKRHVESQFCSLAADKAFFLTQMVKLEGLPSVFIVEEGQVTRTLPPEVLFEFSSASSPLFIKHLHKALLRIGAVTDAEGGGGDTSEEEDEEEDSYARRRGNRKGIQVF